MNGEIEKQSSCMPYTQKHSPVCTLFSRCDGCPYPGHGFICWNRDGCCIREAMRKINQEELKET